MSLVHQVEQATHAWAAKGNKAGRARQRRMMYRFASHAEAHGARDKGQIGGRVVISFWKALRAEKGLSWATQMDYWRALRELWPLLGLSGEVPAPRNPAPSPSEEQPAGGAAP